MHGPWQRFARRVRGAISWNRVFRATSYARSALWVIPLVAVALVLMLAPVLRSLDDWLDWRFTNLGLEGARALLNTTITLTLSFLVFTFGSLLVAIQVAAGQMTPRIIATTLLRDNVVRYSVGLFVFTLMLAVTSLNRMADHVNQGIAFLVAVLALACLTDFLFFIDYAARMLRPGTVVARLGENGIRVIGATYPELLDDATGDPPPAPPPAGAPARVAIHEGASGVLVAIDVGSLVAGARRSGGLIEVVPQLGDFVAFGEPLFRLHAGAERIPDRRLLQTVAFGPERTLEQDPMFAFRILVDIALKALSRAINDPTTATLAIDQIHRLLRYIGQRKLRGEAHRDSDGAVRVLLRTPDWEDYVRMACSEVRACGASSVQVTRRLVAMLDDLGRLLPAHRRPALALERRLLEATLKPLHPLPEDLALALEPDIQGMGGATRARHGDVRA